MTVGQPAPQPDGRDRLGNGDGDTPGRRGSSS